MSGAPASPRSFLLTNATLISMDERLPQQLPRAAVLVADGIIQQVYTSDADLPTTVAVLPRIDAAGMAVLPGLTDGHAHLDRETLGDDLPGFAGASSVADILDVVAQAAVNAQPGEWIVTRPLGTPPDYTDADDPFGGGRLPDRHDLDSVSPDNPVFIRPIWGFWNMRAKKISFANSLALAAAGISAETLSPHDDLVIERDARGNPTGRFVETAHQPLIEHTLLRVAPGFTRHQRAAAIRNAFERYASFGTTAVFEGHGIASEVLDAYLDAYAAAGSARLRASLPLSPHWPEIGDLRGTLEGWRGDFELLAGRFAGVDGVFIGGAVDETATALRSANHPRTGWAGFAAGAFVPMADVEQLLLDCARSGVRVAGLAKNLLEIFARVDGQVPIGGLGWTLGHQPTLSRDQIDVAADLGVMMTTITGHHLHRGVFTRDLVGTDRESEIVPVKSLMDAGVPVVLGSDNRPISIWDSMVHVVSREDERGVIVAPDEAVSRYDALKLVTVNGARLTGDEDKRGVIRPGLAADFAVLDRNPLECDLAELAGTRSVLTLVDGHPVSTDGTLAL
ncbi:amidohydrolase family protein [Cryobacterium sp. BB307]|uniref:amidohydrolase n=1 Tax=Cryobacterium sp. BB307 TaxID=2716317 RepID=UPI0014466F97|nr:amidohydrolase family protein [Cryobacterium sp. BB307]